MTEHEKTKSSVIGELGKLFSGIIINHILTGICSYPFFVMAGNYFYRKQDKFVPAELALIKFTFRSGIQERYHAYLNPGIFDLIFCMYDLVN